MLSYPTCEELQAVSERHCIALLLFLYENDGCQKIAIYRNVVRNYTGLNKLNMLASVGLIEEEKNPRGSIIYLTPKGKVVAEALNKLNITLSEMAGIEPVEKTVL